MLPCAEPENLLTAAFEAVGCPLDAGGASPHIASHRSQP